MATCLGSPNDFTIFLTVMPIAPTVRLRVGRRRPHFAPVPSPTSSLCNVIRTSGYHGGERIGPTIEDCAWVVTGNRGHKGSVGVSVGVADPADAGAVPFEVSMLRRPVASL